MQIYFIYYMMEIFIVSQKHKEVILAIKVIGVCGKHN